MIRERRRSREEKEQTRCERHENIKELVKVKQAKRTRIAVQNVLRHVREERAHGERGEVAVHHEDRSYASEKSRRWDDDRKDWAKVDENTVMCDILPLFGARMYVRLKLYQPLLF